MDISEQDNSDELIELISDGTGLAVLGSAAAVEEFMASTGLTPREEHKRGTAQIISAGSGAAEVASKYAENSGRWLKMTAESTKKLKDLGGLTPTTTPGISHAMIGPRGATKSWIQVVNSPGTALTSPAALAGFGGMMAQMAMQQQLNQIQDYLEAIDQKLDDLIRSQMNQVLSRVDAAGLAIAEAMTVRETVGRVSEVSWSKVQSQPTAILETQAFALRQLADLVDKFDKKKSVSDLVKACKETETEIVKWLAILARCFELQDAHAILELDRVMDSTPEELDRHRLGLGVARRERIELFERATKQILAQLDEAAATANRKVLFNPQQTPEVVASRNYVATEIGVFHEVMGIETEAGSSDARRWRDAATDKLVQARETGTKGLGEAKRAGGKAMEQTTSARDKISTKFTERRRHKEVDDKKDPF